MQLVFLSDASRGRKQVCPNSGGWDRAGLPKSDFWQLQRWTPACRPSPRVTPAPSLNLDGGHGPTRGKPAGRDHHPMGSCKTGHFQRKPVPARRTAGGLASPRSAGARFGRRCGCALTERGEGVYSSPNISEHASPFPVSPPITVSRSCQSATCPRCVRPDKPLVRAA